MLCITRLEKLKLPAVCSSVFAQVGTTDQSLVRISFPTRVPQPTLQFQSKGMISVKATGNRQSDARENTSPEDVFNVTIIAVNDHKNSKILNWTKLKEATKFSIKKSLMHDAGR